MICYALAIFVSGCVLMSSVLLFDRREVLRVTNPKIEPNPVVLGRLMRLTWDAQEFRNCEGSVQRVIIDSSNRVFYFAAQATAYHSASDPSAIAFSTSPIYVPTDLHIAQGQEGGEAEYVSYIRRWCNFMQRIFWPMTEEPRRVRFRFITEEAATRQKRSDVFEQPQSPPTAAPAVQPELVEEEPPQDKPRAMPPRPPAFALVPAQRPLVRSVEPPPCVSAPGQLRTTC